MASRQTINYMERWAASLLRLRSAPGAHGPEAPARSRRPDAPLQGPPLEERRAYKRRPNGDEAAGFQETWQFFLMVSEVRRILKYTY